MMAISCPDTRHALTSGTARSAVLRPQARAAGDPPPRGAGAWTPALSAPVLLCISQRKSGLKISAAIEEELRHAGFVVHFNASVLSQ
jgi:hypothetical protein